MISSGDIAEKIMQFHWQKTTAKHKEHSKPFKLIENSRTFHYWIFSEIKNSMLKHLWEFYPNFCVSAQN